MPGVPRQLVRQSAGSLPQVTDPAAPYKPPELGSEAEAAPTRAYPVRARTQQPPAAPAPPQQPPQRPQPPQPPQSQRPLGVEATTTPGVRVSLPPLATPSGPNRPLGGPAPVRPPPPRPGGPPPAASPAAHPSLRPTGVAQAPQAAPPRPAPPAPSGPRIDRAPAVPPRPAASPGEGEATQIASLPAEGPTNPAAPSTALRAMAAGRPPPAGLEPDAVTHVNAPSAPQQAQAQRPAARPPAARPLPQAPPSAPPYAHPPPPAAQRRPPAAQEWDDTTDRERPAPRGSAGPSGITGTELALELPALPPEPPARPPAVARPPPSASLGPQTLGPEFAVTINAMPASEVRSRLAAAAAPAPAPTRVTPEPQQRTQATPQRAHPELGHPGPPVATREAPRQTASAQDLEPVEPGPADPGPLGDALFEDEPAPDFEPAREPGEEEAPGFEPDPEDAAALEEPTGERRGARAALGEVEAVEVIARPASTVRTLLAFAVDALALASLSAGALLALSAARGLKGLPHSPSEVLERLLKLGPLAAAVLVAVALVYATLFAWANRGRTPGRLLAGLRVVDGRGGSPGLVRAALRGVLSLASFALLMTGFWLALVDRKGRSLHDKLSGTFVVRLQAPGN